MYFCRDLKLAYIRVPKTASTSFVNAFGSGLKRNGPDHETITQARRRIATDWDHYAGYTQIGFVRHPLAWFRSIYAMARRSATHWAEFASGVYEPECSPSQFLELLNKTPFDWFVDPDTGEMLIDKVHRTEDLAEVCQSYGLREPKHMNSTDDLPDFEWSASDRELARQKFTRELAFYEGL